MNREAVRATLPSNLQQYQNDPFAYKGIVETFIDEALSQIQKAGREPDWWEAESLLYAIGLARCGFYRAALAYAEHAITPEEHRSPEARPRAPEILLSVRVLENELTELRMLPIRNH